MDEKSEAGQKESIDEILADLNNLLNKMPAILESIKLPDIAAAAKPDSGLATETEWTSASGSAKLPEPEAADRAEDTFEGAAPPKTVRSPAPPPEPGCAKLPEPEALTIEDSVSGAAVPQEESKPVPPPPPVLAPDYAKLPKPEALTAEEEASVAAEQEETLPPAFTGPAPDPLETISAADEIKPEIASQPDAGMEIRLPLSEGEKAPDAASMQEGGGAVENAVNPEPEKGKKEETAVLFETTHDFGVPDIDTLIRLSQEKASPAAETAGAGKEPEKAGCIPLPPGPASVPVAPAKAASDTQSSMETDLENIIIVPRAGNANREGEAMDIKKDSPETGEPASQGQPAPEAGAVAGEPRIELSSPQDFTLKIDPPASAEPGFVIKQTNLTAGAAEEDKTVNIPPPSVRVDFSFMEDKPAPDGIPPERVKTVAFLFAQEDANLCADLLAELDAICLKSASKPMFIKRGFVMICAPGTDGNAYMQKVSESGAMGLICVGNVPRDLLYEIENVFAGAGMFFKHVSHDVFSHSAVLDLLTEIILK